MKNSDIIMFRGKPLKRRKDGRFKKIISGIPVFAYTKEELEFKVREIESRSEIGALFSSVAEDWKDEHFSTIAYTTQKSYESVYKCIVGGLGDKPIKRITPIEIQNYIYDVARNKYRTYIKKCNSENGMSQRTVKNNLMIIRMIFDYAALKGILSANPAFPVRLPKGLSKIEREPPQDGDIDIINNSINIDFGFFPFLLLYTGLRRGEALALKYEDIDHKNKTILINKSLYFENNRPKIKTPKTRAGERVVMAPQILLDYLPKGKGFIFSENGEPLSERMYRFRWKKYVNQTGIKITPHQLRHQYATYLYEAGIDDKSAQSLLGHSSIAVTKDVYTHISKQKESATHDKLNEFFEKVQTLNKPHN